MELVQLNFGFKAGDEQWVIIIIFIIIVIIIIIIIIITRLIFGQFRAIFPFFLDDPVYIVILNNPTGCSLLESVYKQEKQNQLSIWFTEYFKCIICSVNMSGFGRFAENCRIWGGCIGGYCGYKVLGVADIQHKIARGGSGGKY